MKLIFIHNWYYVSAESGEIRAAAAIEAMQKNLESFPFSKHSYEIASAEAKAGGDHYWLLLFLVTSDDPGDDSAAIRERIENWLKSIGVSPNDDRTFMTPRFDTLQECFENAYRGAYTLHSIIRSGSNAASEQTFN